ncbi:NADH-quinone oxidoreductase subunit NuoH [Novibacillus thermophilus]|uniref:NADH-quinone oxidoreductase subunit H n=1 Tax=Novibacillus thermophilus TaxID=1471761 RepID=A0A1U9KB00_9BACL|nr:NADH-quinone oxidoreductase subunit NuoH [Novibacillus thermophilus]AQS57186.1 NADH-quinone oxidoreductase subunit H [Novibacillus thermophilus]
MGQLLSQPLSPLNATLFTLGAVALLLVILGFVTYAILFERKVLGWVQLRHGPVRVGPWGMFQTVADILKLLVKEDTIPAQADKPLFKIAPIIAFVPSFAIVAVIPFTENLYFTDIGVALLYYLALTSITVIGILTGGWSSNNNYALLGAMRSAAQMISYEIPLILSVVGVILAAGSLNMIDIVEAQQNMWFIVPQILGFVIFLIASIAELNRVPFDLPEAESELVAGYFVEYSGFRWAFFMLAEYVYIFAMSSLTTVLFLGGWHPPFDFLGFIPGIVWFLLKFLLIVFFLFWVRATLPRIRIDQLMSLGWKVLLPLAIANIFLSALLKEVPWISQFY